MDAKMNVAQTSQIFWTTNVDFHLLNGEVYKTIDRY